MRGRQRGKGRIQGPSPATGAPDSQLAFPFAGRARAHAAGAAAADGAPRPRSRRALRGEAPGRELRAPDLERSADELRIERGLLASLPAGKRLRVTLTDNRYTMVMVRRFPDGYSVRLHRMFVGVEPRLLRVIARYVVYNDAQASAQIGAFIEKNQHVIRRQPQRARRVVLRPAGRAHDLQSIFDRLNAQHFGGSLEARITWGSAPRRLQPRRSIKMGSFAVEDRIIRIHPVLDHPSVPDYFVAWIVFHEMLHGKHEILRKGARRCFHSHEFLEEERSFPEYERACAWERANIDRLLGG